MKKIVLLSGLLIGVFNSNAQHTKYLSFDLLYLINQQDLTFSQEEKLEDYLGHVISCNILQVFIDTSISKSNGYTNKQRIHFLKSFFREKHIDTSRIQVLKLPKQHSDFVHNLSDDVDALNISISYSSETPMQTVLHDQEKQISSEKILYVESGDLSTEKATQRTCNNSVIISLLDDYQLIINSCDYEDYSKDIVFNNFEGPEKDFFEYGPVLNNMTTVLGSYFFKIKGNKKLMFPATLNIPIEKCIDKFDLALFLCRDSTCKLIPMENLYSPEDDYISFKIKDRGVYYFVYTNSRKENKVSFEVKGNYKINYFEVTTRCQNILYMGDIEKNKVEIVIPETYYEPIINLVVTDHQGKEYQLINKPISDLEGTTELTKYKVFDYYGKQEKEIKLQEKYFIYPSQLKQIRN